MCEREQWNKERARKLDVMWVWRRHMDVGFVLVCGPEEERWNIIYCTLAQNGEKRAERERVGG